MPILLIRQGEGDRKGRDDDDERTSGEGDYDRTKQTNVWSKRQDRHKSLDDQ